MPALNMFSRIQIFLNPELIRVNAFQDEKNGKYTFEVHCSPTTYHPLVSVDTLCITKEALLNQINQFLNSIYITVSRDMLDPNSLIYKSLTDKQRSFDPSLTLTPEKINRIIFQLASSIPEERTIYKPSDDTDDPIDRYLRRITLMRWREE